MSCPSFRVVLYGTLMLYAIVAVYGAAHAKQSWQDRPNVYDPNGYDNDGGYRGGPEVNTWGHDFSDRDRTEHEEDIRNEGRKKSVGQSPRAPYTFSRGITVLERQTRGVSKSSNPSRSALRERRSPGR